MNRLDTITIAFPLCWITVKTEDYVHYFTPSTYTHKKTGEVVEKWRLDASEVRKVLGLASLEIEDGLKVTLRFSAKSLGADYCNGITANNIETAIRSALPKWIECEDISRVVIASEVHLVDVAVNVPILGTTVETVLSQLATVPQNPRYKRDTLGRGRVETVEFKTRIKSDPLHPKFKVYNKAKEMSRPSQRAYSEILNASSFANVLRLEASYMHHSDIRSAFGIAKGKKSIMLEDVLHSRKPVVMNAFDHILPQSETLSVMKTEQKLADQKNRVFYTDLFERSNWEWRIAEHQLRAYYAKGTNPHRQIREGRRWYDLLVQERGLTNTPHIEQLRAYLRSLD